MLNEVTATQSKVYKLAVGTDASFVLIHTGASTNPYYFIVDGNMLYFGNGTDMKKYDGTTVTNWGITAPSVAPTLAVGAGTLTGTYYYIYAYYNSATGHISSPSPVSAALIPAGQGIAVSVTASADTQVTGIKIYRTTAGGDGIFFEVTGSPFANTTGVAVTDTTADSALNTGSAIATSVAARSRLNDPPPAANGFAYYAGRIWMFVDNKVWYTKFEEDASGVLAECVPGGSGGNFFPYDNQVNGVAAVEDGVLVFTAKNIFKIEGDSQNTFRRYTVADFRGSRAQACIARNGRAVTWLDTANQLWATDGYKLEEVGIPIRLDIDSISQTQAEVVFVEKGGYRWLVLNDVGASRQRIFDLDTEQWLPPWNVPCTAMWAGETAAGTVEFCACVSGVVRKMAGNIFTDGSAAYTSSLGTSLIPITSGKAGVVDEIVTEYAGTAPTVKRQYDDDPFDPSVITYSTMTATDPLFITEGTILRSDRYVDKGLLGSATKSGRGRRVSFLLEWPADGFDFQLYSVKMEAKDAV